MFVYLLSFKHFFGVYTQAFIKCVCNYFLLLSSLSSFFGSVLQNRNFIFLKSGLYFVNCVFGIVSRKLLSYPKTSRFFLMLSSQGSVYSFVSMFRFMIIWADVCEGVKSFFFGMWICSYSSTVYCSIVLPLFLSQKLTMLLWLYFWALCSIDSFVCSFSNSTLSVLL